MKTLPWIITICVTTLFGHYFIVSQDQIETLKFNEKLTEKARQIESDSVRDLMYSNTQLAQKSETIGTQRYIAGVVDVIQRPDHSSEIWHAGYERGVETEKFSQDSLKAQKKKAEKLVSEVKNKYPEKK